MERVDQMLHARRRVEARYERGLAGLPGVRTLDAHAGTASVPWLVTVLTDLDEAGRDRLMALMAERGVETRPVFYPMHVMPAHARPARASPVSERAGASGLSLPTWVGLPDDDVDTVVGALADCLQVLRPVASGRASETA